MVKEYKTIRDAIELWLHEMNSITQVHCRSRYRNWADVPAVVLSDSDDLLMRRCRPWN